MPTQPEIDLCGIPGGTCRGGVAPTPCDPSRNIPIAVDAAWRVQRGRCRYSLAQAHLNST
jgi:hypothetical protein